MLNILVTCQITLGIYIGKEGKLNIELIFFFIKAVGHPEVWSETWARPWAESPRRRPVASPASYAWWACSLPGSPTYDSVLPTPYKAFTAIQQGEQIQRITFSPAMLAARRNLSDQAEFF
jgi:hypothetical protein